MSKVSNHPFSVQLTLTLEGDDPRSDFCNLGSVELHYVLCGLQIRARPNHGTCNSRRKCIRGRETALEALHRRPRTKA
jgi:hypothetical protein